MALVGTIFKSASVLARKKQLARLREEMSYPENHQRIQEKELKALLSRAIETEFGSKYSFSNLLNRMDFANEFRKTIPIFNYNYMFKKFWHKTPKWSRGRVLAWKNIKFCIDIRY